MTLGDFMKRLGPSEYFSKEHQSNTKKNKMDIELQIEECKKITLNIFDKIKARKPVIPNDVKAIISYISQPAVLEEVLKDKTTQQAILKIAAVFSYQLGFSLFETLLSFKVANDISLHEKEEGVNDDTLLRIALDLSRMNNDPTLLHILFRNLPYEQVMPQSIAALNEDIDEMMPQAHGMTAAEKLRALQDEIHGFLITTSEVVDLQASSIIETAVHSALLLKSLSKNNQFKEYLGQQIKVDFVSLLKKFLILFNTAPQAVDVLLSQGGAMSQLNDYLSKNKYAILLIMRAAIACATGEMPAPLEKLLTSEAVLQTPLSEYTKNKEINDELLTALAVCAVKVPMLSSCVEKYFKTQGVDINEYKTKMENELLTSIIYKSNLSELKKFIEQDYSLNNFPTLAAIISSMHVRLSVGRQDIKKELTLLEYAVAMGASVEYQANGVTPLFEAIKADLKFGTTITRTLLEAIRRQDKTKIASTINAQCTKCVDNMEASFNPNIIPQDEEEKQKFLESAKQAQNAQWTADSTPLHAIFIFAKALQMENSYMNKDKLRDNQKQLIKLLLLYKPNLTLKDANDKSVNDLLSNFNSEDAMNIEEAGLTNVQDIAQRHILAFMDNPDLDPDNFESELNAKIFKTLSEMMQFQNSDIQLLGETKETFDKEHEGAFHVMYLQKDIQDTPELPEDVLQLITDKAKRLMLG